MEAVGLESESYREQEEENVEGDSQGESQMTTCPLDPSKGILHNSVYRRQSLKGLDRKVNAMIHI